jgi:RecB family exonuclease
MSPRSGPGRPDQASTAERTGRKGATALTGGGAGHPNAVTRFLADFCRGHPLEEKVFIAPSSIIGRQIGHALAREAGSWANLRFVTLAALAEEILVGAEAEVPARPITPSAQLALVDRSFRELLGRGALKYFGRAGASPGLVRTLFRAIQDLRLDGLSSAELRPERFLVVQKGEEIALLLHRYERALEERSLLDTAGLMALAGRTAAAAGPIRGWHLCLADVPLKKTESDLVRAVGGARLVLVPGDPVFGLSRPRHCWPSPESGSLRVAAAGRLSWLFAPGEAPSQVGRAAPEIFRALGPANECREILRRIYAGQVRFDDVEVLPPPGLPHEVIFHLLSVRTGLPVTFGCGLPVSFTSPGRLFFGLADWLAEDLSVDRLDRLIAGGDLVLPPGTSGRTPAARTACRLFRTAMIGWGRERYLERLGALRAGRQADLELAGSEESEETDETPAERRARLLLEVEEIDDLSSAVERLLAILPETKEGNRYDLRDLCSAFAVAMQTCGRAASDADRQAREALLARLREIGDEGSGQVLPLEEALDLLREAGASVRVGASAPRPGHLHVADCLTGGWSGRPVTFVVGLDEASFPGRGLQDPVLLDEERAALSPSLPTSADGLRAELFRLASVLASLRGEVTVSYPSFDIIEGRASFPSSVVLQAHRLGRGDAGLDYSALDRDLPEAAGFVPHAVERVFDEVDWWLAQLASSGRSREGEASVAANFADLASGLAAASCRAGDLLTEYEGLVDIGPVRDRVDPVASRKAVMSATRLELLARCPFGYFLRHILGVKPPEEVKFDPARWLDPLQRGRLIHAIFCKFMTEVSRKKERVEAEKHWPNLAGLASQLVDREALTIPPPSATVFESERRDILESMRIFLAAEEKRGPEEEPLEFEKKFAAEEFELGRGRSFLLRGFIDRLDRTGPASFRVLDYKTGSYAPYEDLVAFGRGRAIQHALYAMVVDGLLRRGRAGPAPRVTESGYLFPTRRGEGREIIVHNFDRGRLRDLLNDLLRLLEKGYFIAGPEAKCGFCDYAPVCEGAPGVTNDKRAVLETLLGLIDEKCVIAGVGRGGGKIDLAPACGGDTAAARARIEAGLDVYIAHDKLDEYE